MGMWTHCEGAMCIIGTDEELKTVDILIGKELNYNSSREEWEYAFEHRDEYMPLGSEGSIHLRKTRKRKPVKSLYSDEQRFKKYYVFEGNLRDVMDTSGVVHWFSELLYKIQHFPYSQVVVVDARFEADCMDQITFQYRTEQDVYIDE